MFPSAEWSINIMPYALPLSQIVEYSCKPLVQLIFSKEPSGSDLFTDVQPANYYGAMRTDIQHVVIPPSHKDPSQLLIRVAFSQIPTGNSATLGSTRDERFEFHLV